MQQPVSEPGGGKKILQHVHEGMKVYDRNDKEVGSVEAVFMGSVSEQDEVFGTGPVQGDPAPLPDEEVFLPPFAFGGATSVNEQDEESRFLRERLNRDGFIRINTRGLFSSDRYATPDQIASISNDRVYLHVDDDDLIHR